jgi:hypothetical protein
MKFAYIDLEQAESRLVGAIEWELFMTDVTLTLVNQETSTPPSVVLAWRDQLTLDRRY